MLLVTYKIVYTKIKYIFCVSVTFLRVLTYRKDNSIGSARICSSKKMCQSHIKDPVRHDIKSSSHYCYQAVII